MLDVGSGSGYLSAVLHHLVISPSGAEGKVIGIEHIPELVDFAIGNLKKDGLSQALEESRIIMIAGDGRKGYPQEGRSNSDLISTSDADNGEYSTVRCYTRWCSRPNATRAACRPTCQSWPHVYSGGH